MRHIETMLAAVAVSLGHSTYTIEEERYRPRRKPETQRGSVVAAMFDGVGKPEGGCFLSERPKGKRAKRRAVGKARAARSVTA